MRKEQGREGREGTGIKEEEEEDRGPFRGKGVEREGTGGNGQEGERGRGAASRQGSGNGRGGGEGKEERGGEGQEGSAITGTNSYCCTVTDPRGGIILNKCYN